jgi:PAS domain S-box-containing protein
MTSSFTSRLRDHPNARYILIFLTLIITLAANLYGLFIGISIVIPHLFYIPIILTAFFYPKRGVPFAVILSGAYLLMVVIVHPGTSPDILSAAARCVVYITIGAVVSYLSKRVRTKEQELVRAKEEWEHTFNAVPDLIALIGKDHRILRVNKAMADNLGISQDKAAGMQCYEVVHGSKTPPANCPHTMLMKDGMRHESEIHEDKLGGDFMITTSPLTDTSGSLIGSVHVARDITERKKLDEALQQALKKLNMLSSITRHDILNQITGLRTYLEMSREDLEGTPFAEFVEREDQAAAAIQRQIEFTKYYQDIGVNAPGWQDAAGVIREAVTELSPAGTEIHIGVANLEIFADPLIVKVFFNLMENSLRHGERVSRMAFISRETEAGLIITYSDNGVGISVDDKKKLFRRGFGKHTGLGLFLSREILAITGIIITENGEPGTGVRFEIAIPKSAYRYTS